MKRASYIRTPEINQKSRISAIRHIENTRGKISPNIGKYETQLLNEQEVKDNCKIIRQFRIKNLGYIVDGYCPETNTVYEVYEQFHNKKQEKDLQRQKEICNHLNCKFQIES